MRVSRGQVLRLPRSVRGWGPWARRGVVAAVLIAAAATPSHATSQATSRCTGARCTAAGSVLWTTRLTGSWLAQGGVAGTTPSQGEAYAASSGSLAVLGYGTTIFGYQARTGGIAWLSDLSWLPPGSVVISVRAWPTAVAVGVSVPGSRGGQDRREIILSAATGTELRSYPAAQYGGAVLASSYSTVIIGARSVIDYANRSGRVIWRLNTGLVPQTWAVSGQDLYITRTSAGYMSMSPVTAVSRIDLHTGKHTIIRLRGAAPAGTLAAVVGGVLLFTGNGGLLGYSAQSGMPLWREDQGVLDLIDHVAQTVYVASGDDLKALNVRTGDALGRPASSVAPSLYAVRGGVALGLDENALGEAWGYSMSAQRAVWTSAALPWPHFFIDQTGLGGSISRAGSIALLTTCAATGTPRAAGDAAVCLRPELAAVQY